MFWGLEAPGLGELDNGNFKKWLAKTEEEVAQGRDPCLVGSCQAQVCASAGGRAAEVLSHVPCFVAGVWLGTVCLPMQHRELTSIHCWQTARRRRPRGGKRGGGIRGH